MNSSIVIVSTIVGIIFLSFGLFMFAFLFFHNKKMVTNKSQIQSLELEKAKRTLIESLEVQEAERARIGADLHDDLGPTLSAIKLKANHLKGGNESQDKKLQQLRSMIDETIKTVRGISHSLYPTTLENYGIADALKELGSRINEGAIKSTIALSADMEDLSAFQKINLYRVIQEFCNNSIKHSNCTNITISTEVIDDALTVKVSDNGDGFDLEHAKSGLGLRNMQMRAESIDFSFNLDSSPDHGTSIVLIKETSIPDA